MVITPDYSFLRILDFGSVITRYCLVYGSLRSSILKETVKGDAKKNTGLAYILNNSLLLGTYILPKWDMYYANSNKTFPVAYYTGEDNDFIVVELVDLCPNSKDGTLDAKVDSWKLYEMHYVLDKYEGIHTLYAPVLMKVQVPNNNQPFVVKIFEGLFDAVSEKNFVPNGDFCKHKDPQTAYQQLIYCNL